MEMEMETVSIKIPKGSTPFISIVRGDDGTLFISFTCRHKDKTTVVETRQVTWALWCTLKEAAVKFSKAPNVIQGNKNIEQIVAVMVEEFNAYANNDFDYENKVKD